MFSIMARGAGGRLVDTATRLVTEAPVPQPPYNAVLRFRDEGDRPLRQQAVDLLSPMIDRGVSPVWVVHPTTDPSIRDVLADSALHAPQAGFDDTDDTDDTDDAVDAMLAVAARKVDEAWLASWLRERVTFRN